DGDMTAMPDHSPVITTLRPGVLRAMGADGEQAYAVTGGFAEISAESASVLAEEAVTTDEATGDWFAAKIAAAEAALEIAVGEEAKIIAAQRINDFRFLQSRMTA
ncbi:MAG: F0F1 ATP synthase subunit epsilon, partial [Pseudomonadota bacterium]